MSITPEDRNPPGFQLPLGGQPLAAELKIENGKLKILVFCLGFRLQGPASPTVHAAGRAAKGRPYCVE